MLSKLATQSRRTLRACRDDAGFHLLGILSLVVAFLCLSGALLSLTNLEHLATHFAPEPTLAILLAQPAVPESKLALLRKLEELNMVDKVTALGAAQKMLDVALIRGTPPDQVQLLIKRLRNIDLVERVDAIPSPYDPLRELIQVGLTGTISLLLLVGLCVVAVIANTIRLAIHHRREELQVLQLCGATRRFICAPFLWEGTLLGLLSALIAQTTLFLLFQGLPDTTLQSFQAVLGVKPVFIHPLSGLAVLLFGSLMGVLGSALSLRRYLTY